MEAVFLFIRRRCKPEMKGVTVWQHFEAVESEIRSRFPWLSCKQYEEAVKELARVLGV